MISLVLYEAKNVAQGQFSVWDIQWKSKLVGQEQKLLSSFGISLSVALQAPGNKPLVTPF